MADTYTTNLNLTKPEPGAAEDTWGISLNADLDALDAIFSTSGTQINLNPNQINFADNKKAIFGTGSDLQIFHDGSNSFIKEVGTGDLRILASAKIDFRSNDDATVMIRANAGGSVDLRYAGDRKLATSSTGIDVTGTVVSDGLTVEGATTPVLRLESETSFLNVNEAGKIEFYTNDASTNATGIGAEIIADSVSTLASIDLVFKTRNSAVSSSTANRLKVANTGDISFYDDTGTSQNLKWDASADSLDFVDGAKARFGAGNDFQVEHDGLDTTLKNYNGSLYFMNLADDKDVFIKSDNGSGGSANYFQADGSTGETKLFHYGSEKISTKSTGIDVTGTVTSDGLVIDTNTDSFNDNAKLEGLVGDIRFNYTQFGGSGNYGGSLDFYTKESSTVKRLRQRIANNGDISFYDDTGTTQGFFWDASAERLGIGTTNPTYKLHVAGASYLSGGIQLNSSDRVKFGNGNQYITGVNDTSLTLVTGSSASVTVLDNGSVGIGTNNPSELLTLKGSSDSQASTKIAFLNDSGGNNRVYIDHIRSGNDSSLAFGTTTNTGSASERLRINHNGNIGIGTSSPSFAGGSGLEIERAGIATLRLQDTTNVANVELQSGESGLHVRVGANGSSGDLFNVSSAGTSRLLIDTSGNVGIGTDSPTNGNLQIGDSDADFNIAVAGARSKFGYDSSNNSAVVQGGITKGIIFCVNNSTFGSGEAGRFDSSGNFGIGTTTVNAGLQVSKGSLTTPAAGTSNAASCFGNVNSNGNFGVVIGANSSGTGYISSQRTDGTATTYSLGLQPNGGNVGIGTDNPTHVLHVKNSSPSFLLQDSNQTGRQTNITHSSGIAKIRSRNNASNGVIAFEGYTASATQEYGRFDNTGNLLVGKTASGLSTDGAELAQGGTAGKVQITRTSNAALLLNRRSTDGTILDLRKDGTTVGSIGIQSSGFYIDGESAHTGLRFTSAGITPRLNGAESDNTVDLGESGIRFKDIYATNGTIQTSDINEKQDIEELSEAETRVAVAAKGLLKKYRWKSAVADKGDDARIHFGIMAQDLQQAFSAEGLDAGDYGMFISSTWTDETTGEEKTRLGVRYNELLAFIIAAI